MLFIHADYFIVKQVLIIRKYKIFLIFRTNTYIMSDKFKISYKYSQFLKVINELKIPYISRDNKFHPAA